jgi:hypothetical protein
LKDGILDDDEGREVRCVGEVLPQVFGQNPLEGGSAKRSLQVHRQLSPAAPDMGVGGALFDVPLPLRMLISYTHDPPPQPS